MSEPETIKAACSHCSGRFSFPTAALGSSIACPHCGKATKLTDPNAPAASDTVKGACTSCNGRIQFPAAAAGSNIACPHCGASTVLSAPGATPASPPPAQAAPAAPSQPSVYRARIPSKKTRSSGGGGKKIMIAIGSVAGVAVLALAAAFLFKKGGGGGAGAPGGEGLEMVNYKVEKASEGGLVYVVGTLTNHDPVQYFSVKVEFDLFDKNDESLGEASDYNGNIAPESGWDFKALVLEENVVKATPRPIEGEKDTGSGPAE